MLTKIVIVICILCLAVSVSALLYALVRSIIYKIKNYRKNGYSTYTDTQCINVLKTKVRSRVEKGNLPVACFTIISQVNKNSAKRYVKFLVKEFKKLYSAKRIYKKDNNALLNANKKIIRLDADFRLKHKKYFKDINA